MFYTDWFEVVGGLLALGGLFSWLAFVSKVLPEDRLKEMQGAVDQRVFCNPKTWRWIALAAGLLVAFTVCFGTVELETRQRPGDYLVQIYPAGASPGCVDHEDFAALRSGETERSVLAWPLSRRRVVHVKGYPAREVTVFPFSRETLVVPDSFAQPVVLLRPSPELIDAARQNNKTLQVTVKRGGAADQTFSMPFDGRAVWVGCDEDVEVPPAVLDRWATELQALNRAPLLRDWAQPRGLFAASPEAAHAASAGQALAPLRLAAGDTLEVILFKDATKTERFLPNARTLEVRPLRRWEDFPQVEGLDVK